MTSFRLLKCILHENSIRYSYCERGIHVVLCLDYIYIVQGKIWKGNPIFMGILICRFFYNRILWGKKKIKKKEILNLAQIIDFLFHFKMSQKFLFESLNLINSIHLLLILGLLWIFYFIFHQSWFVIYSFFFSLENN